MIKPACAVLALAALACSVDPGQDRPGAVVNGIAIDSVRFLPFGSRYVLRDSAAPVAFLGYHAGYVCSRFLELGLTDGPEGDPPAYRPSTRVRLPGDDVCPLDSGDRDTAAVHVFRDGGTIRLADPAGTIMDSAVLVSGRMESNSIRGVPDSGRAFTAGKLTFRDSTSTGKMLEADSVPGCMHLNTAEWEKGAGDTVVVHLTWVIEDPASVAGGCDGGHVERVPVPRRRAWPKGAGGPVD